MNEITYKQNGDYLIPELSLPEQTESIGKYGRMRKNHLKEHRPVLFNSLLLSGKLFATYEPRGQFMGNDPYTRWTKPSAVVMSQNDYSNAHGFPYMYKTLGLGKLVGAPMAGTMTAVWWETQYDGELVVGVPEVAVKDLQGNYLENQTLNPDVEVIPTPEQVLNDDDVQVKRAVDLLLGK